MSWKKTRASFCKEVRNWPPRGERLTILHNSRMLVKEHWFYEHCGTSESLRRVEELRQKRSRTSKFIPTQIIILIRFAGEITPTLNISIITAYTSETTVLIKYHYGTFKNA